MASKRQVAALPVTKARNGTLRVMLVTSRETRRWVIPKGWPWKGIEDHLAAAGEAREEAGLVGEIEAESLGSYHYLKRTGKKKAVSVKVTVFMLRVTRELDGWPEQHERERAWFTPAKAAAAVDEPELAEIIRGLAG